jgi:hypothetical protein
MSILFLQVKRLIINRLTTSQELLKGVPVMFYIDKRRRSLLEKGVSRPTLIKKEQNMRSPLSIN